MLSLLNNYRQYQHYYHSGLILVLAFSRVVTSNVLSCPPDFDCNAYLQMVDNWLYQPQIAGHHAMRILPPIIVKLFTLTGISKVQGFYLLSSITYCAFGALVYYFFKSQKVNPLLALCLSLLCLAPHAAMRIPLQLVYQSCDMMVYPLVLLIFMYSSRKNALAVFALGVIGLLVRQNLFILSLFSLLYCWLHPSQMNFQGCCLRDSHRSHVFSIHSCVSTTRRLPEKSSAVGVKKREIITLVYLMVTIGIYFLLQNYFQANDTFRDLLSPPEGYFSIEHLAWVFWDSKLLELLIPALPLILWHVKPLMHWFWRNWHLSAYMCITIGQPFLAYHMTGNNFPRLALQGFWPIYLALGCVYLSKLQNKRLLGILLIYALSIYFTWGIEQRIYMAGLLTIILLSEQLWHWSVSRVVGRRKVNI